MGKYPSAHLDKLQVRAGYEDSYSEVLSPLHLQMCHRSWVGRAGVQPPPSTDVLYAEKIRLSVGKGTTHLSSCIMVGLRWS